MSMFGKAVKGFAFVLGALALGVATPKEASADGVIRADVVRVPIMLGTQIAIGCMNPGSHQDVAKTPVLKNTTAAPIKKGTLLSWKSSDGDHGTVTLQADLAPNATVQAMGSAGNGYSCTSSFGSAADLTVKKAMFMSSTSASIEIANLDSWVDAPASVTRVEVMSCSSGQPIATADIVPTALKHGEVKAFTVPFAAASGKKYLRVRADVNKNVFEKNETNNLWDDYNSCVW